MKSSAASVVNKLSLHGLARLLWAVALLTLPVTSFRYFPFMGEGTYVRPLAFYPLILLLPVLLVQLFRGKTPLPLPGTLTPLVAFLLAVLTATVFGLLFTPLELRGQDYVGRAVRAWATLGIGLSFFIAAIWMNRDEDALRFTVRWLLAGFVLDILWSGLQAATFYVHLLPKQTVTLWQRAFSMRELVRTNRISGLAYEPAWLAGQIATIYLPWLLAASLTRVRVTRFKWFEPLLLGFSGLLLLATYSRGGLLTAVGAAVLTFLLVGSGEMGAGWKWFVAGFRRGDGWILRVVVVLFILAALAGAFLFLSQKGYIARLWNTQAESVQDFIIENSAGARAAYTWGAMGGYRDHPLMGVGLGASGFYIYQNLPDWALTTVPEIARQLSPQNRLYPNPKNLYVRLLAETGLPGFFLYIAFQFSILGDALSALRRRTGLVRYLGIAGLCSFLAIAFYNITQDSLATPNLWVNFGVLVGISAFAIQSKKSSQETV